MPDDSKDHVHIIVSGENLSAIAKRYHVDINELLAANPEIKNKNRIMVGQRLKIPHAATPLPVMTPPVVPPAAHDTPVPTPAEAAPSGGTAPVRAGMPNTSGMDEAHKYDLYAQYFSRYGVNVAALEPGTRALLGLRVTSNIHANLGRGEYNDRIVVLWRDAKGKHVQEFGATTEPSARYEDTPENRKHYPKRILGVDANRDGRKDSGCLPDGLYQYEKSSSSLLGKVLRPCSDIFVVRDVDHDGDFDDADKAASVADKLNSSRTVLFHSGGPKDTLSAACQTMPKASFIGFWASLGTGQSRYQYALATVA
jgi:hypothetical protein